MEKYEVLSPAGDLECLKTAIRSGADAVYFGLNKFNARLKADNISLDNLEETVRYAHLKGVKTYVTINTLVSDSELKELVDMVGKCIEAGVDAYIVQDYGIIGTLRAVYPGIVLHGSTQLGVHNVRGARVAKSLGLSRVVLSREATLDDIREIKSQVDIELEVFVQGAMCVCFSGNCYLSSLKFGASGNRGLCKQLCRLTYTLSDGNKSKSGYTISPRDNCMVDYLANLCELGVVSFKIEGRLRRSGYVAVATRTYREVVDSITSGKSFDYNMVKKDLQKVFSRGEFISGYNDTKNVIDTQSNAHMGELIGRVVQSTRFKDMYRITMDISAELHQSDGLKFVDDNNNVITLGVGNIDRIGSNIVVYGKNSVKANSKVYRVLDSEFESNIIDKSRKRVVDIQVSAVIGEPLKLTAICEKWVVSVSGDNVQEALKSPLSKEKISENLGKWDRDIFDINSIKFLDFDNNVFLPISSINEARRELAENLICEIVNSYKLDITRCDMPVLNILDNAEGKLAVVDENTDLSKISHEYTGYILAPSVYSVAVIEKFVVKNAKYIDNNIMINLPIIALSKDMVIIDSIAYFATEKGYPLYISNIYGLDYIREGARVIASNNMNITNSYALSTLAGLGVSSAVFSAEKWTGRIQGTYKLGSGKKVLMTFAHCPVSTLYGKGCEKTGGNGECRYRNSLSLKGENNDYTIRRYVVYNCYFELLDEFREDSASNNCVEDLRK